MGARRHEDRNLDMLRAIAVTIVLIYHCAQMRRTDILPRVGHFGVLIFFVHTALVLMMSLDRLASDRLRYFRAFYIQRAFRIYPLSVLCVAAIVVFRIPWIHWGAYAAPSVGRVIANLLLAQNVIGNPQTISVSGPLWSLPYEVQMYIVLPILFWLLARHPVAKTLYLLVAFSLCVASLEIVLLHAWMGVTRFFPCFMGGVVAYFLRGRVRRFIPAALWPVTIVALGTVYYLAPVLNVCSWAACLGLGCILPFFAETKPGMIAMAAHLIARYSYGIYLAHVPMLWLCFYKLSFLALWMKWGLFVTLLPATTVMLYHFVELPMIRAGHRVASRMGSGVRGYHADSVLVARSGSSAD